MVGSPVQFIAIPLLAAFLMPLLGKLWKESVKIIPGLVLIYLGVLSFILYTQVLNNGAIIEQIAGWSAPWGINLVYSSLSGFLATLIIFVGVIVWMYSYRFKEDLDYESSLKYFTMLLLLITAAVGIVITGDIFNQFVFIEILGISSYGLTAFYRGRNAAEAAFKYLFIGSLSSMFLLLAIMILYSQLGTLNMADIAIKAHLLPPTLKIIIVVLFIMAFGIEAEIFPMNGWAPDAYSQAPAPVAAAFSGIVAKAGMYTVIRLVFTLFDIQGTYDFLIMMGIITLVIAEMAAIRQTNIKRMLAYSSIGQMGLVLIGFGIGTEAGVYAALFLMFNHAIIKPLLFLSSGYLVYHSDKKLISEMNGKSKTMPITAFLFALGAFAIIGLPPFAGFWSKLAVLTAAANSQMELIIVLILSVSIIEVVYYLRVVNRLYFIKPEIELDDKKPSLNGLLAMVILGAIVIWVGFSPDGISYILHRATADLLDTQGYIDKVLTISNNLVK